MCMCCPQEGATTIFSVSVVGFLWAAAQCRPQTVFESFHRPIDAVTCCSKRVVGWFVGSIHVLPTKRRDDDFFRLCCWVSVGGGMCRPQAVFERFHRPIDAGTCCSKRVVDWFVGSIHG